MKKLFKRVSILFAALMALSVSTVRTVEEVKAASESTTVYTFPAPTAGSTYTYDFSDSTDESLKHFKMVWKQGSSTSPIATYSNGIRIYKSHKVTFTCDETISSIDKIILNLESKNNSSNTSTWTNGTAVVSGNVVTVTTTGTEVSYTASNQVRWKSIQFYYTPADTGVELTDEAKVSKSLNSVVNTVSSFYGLDSEVDIPAENEEYGVDLSYSIEGASDVYSISDNKLSIKPTNAFYEGKLTVTASLGDVSQTADVIIYTASTTKVLPLSEAVKVGQHFGSSYSSDKFYIEVTIKSIYNTQYGNAYVNDGTVSDDFIVYGLYSSNGSTRYDAMEVKPLAGDKIKVYGILGTYSNAAQMKNGWITEHTISHTNEELIAMEETSFSLSFDYALTYKEEEVEGTGVETTASLSFADKAQRTSYSTSQQVWEQNGIKLTGEKAASTTNVGDYANPARFYANSSVSVEVAEGCTISEIVFTTTEGAAALVSSIGDEASASGNIVTCKPTNSSNVYEIAKLSAKVFVSSISVKYASVGGTVEVVDDQAYANVGLTFGAKVTSTLFEGYTKVSGGVMIDNAANYTNTTIAEAYANGEFKGITTSKESLKLTDDGFYSVGSTIEVIDGLVDENNKKYLSYEFVAAVYFTLENAEGTTTVVLEQKTYSVSTMVDYYLANSSSLGLTDEAVKVVEAFDAFIG